jgi:hypothetical protein
MHERTVSSRCTIAGKPTTKIRSRRRASARSLNRHPIRAERDTVRPTEHQAVILVVNAELAFLLLSCAVSGKRFSGERDERHPPATLRDLGALNRRPT